MLSLKIKDIQPQLNTIDSYKKNRVVDVKNDSQKKENEVK